MYVLGHSVNFMLPYWNGEQLKQSDAILVNQTLQYAQ